MVTPLPCSFRRLLAGRAVSRGEKHLKQTGDSPRLIALSWYDTQRSTGVKLEQTAESTLERTIIAYGIWTGRFRQYGLKNRSPENPICPV